MVKRKPVGDRIHLVFMRGDQRVSVLFNRHGPWKGVMHEYHQHLLMDWPAPVSHVRVTEDEIKQWLLFVKESADV